MKITLKDGSVKEYSEAKSVYEIAKDISEGLARVACAGEIDGEIVDLRTQIDRDVNLNIVTSSDGGGGKTPVSRGKNHNRPGHCGRVLL